MVKTELDFSIKCRACFAEKQEMHHLYREFDQGLTLSDILKNTTSFDVYEDDGLSPYFCESCTGVVVDFFNFKTIYQENEKYIRSLLQENNVKSIILLNTVDDSHERADMENLKHTQIETSKGYNNNNCSNRVNNAKNKTIDTEIRDTINIALITEDEQCSQKQNANNEELEITVAFVKPQELFKNDVSLSENENSCEIKNETVEVINFCEMCGKSFSLKSEFMQHMFDFHRISIFESEKCASKTISKIASFGIKDENTVSHCHICKDESKTCSEIESHYKLHRKYICEHCGAVFLKKSYLNDHREVHTTEKRHICPICGKAFRRRTVLIKHKRLHTHPRQCVCEICGLRFNDRGTLKTHINLKHIRDRKFPCSLCGLWFPLKSTLEKHTFRHNENREREFICSICNMAYRDKSSLNRHIVVKHTENAKKPSCKDCGKQYTTNTNLLKHIRKYHSASQNSIKLESD